MYIFLIKKRIRKRILIKRTIVWLKVHLSQNQFCNNKQVKYHNFIFRKASPLIMWQKRPPEARSMQLLEIRLKSLNRWWKNLHAMCLAYQVISQRFYPSELQEKLMLKLWRKLSSKNYGNSCKTNRSNTGLSICSVRTKRGSSV